MELLGLALFIVLNGVFATDAGGRKVLGALLLKRSPPRLRSPESRCPPKRVALLIEPRAEGWLPGFNSESACRE
ncbi:MAG TPA: hypothetical protein VLD36_20375 [Burkholderiales bacterium]|nr:hypothetical protein [Burkholderiales bacterium]